MKSSNSGGCLFYFETNSGNKSVIQQNVESLKLLVAILVLSLKAASSINLAHCDSLVCE